MFFGCDEKTATKTNEYQYSVDFKSSCVVVSSTDFDELDGFRRALSQHFFVTLLLSSVATVSLYHSSLSAELFSGKFPLLQIFVLQAPPENATRRSFDEQKTEVRRAILSYDERCFRADQSSHRKSLSLLSLR